jgi:iron complex outermembrane receptor protein
LSPRHLDRAGVRTDLRLRFGEAEARQIDALHVGRSQNWAWLAAASWRERDGFLVPADLEAAYHQPDRRLRTNSQFEQGSILLRGQRRVGRGHLAVLLQGTDGSKGVPPETHIEDARFWQYPKVRRALLGISYERPAVDRGWDVQAALSFDSFAQQIRPFDDATYSSPELAPGVDFEDGKDRTAYGRVRVAHGIGASELAVATTARATRRHETLEIDGPEQVYSQSLGSIAAEWSRWIHDVWQVEAGAGYEIATTPETGDKPARDSTQDPVLRLGLERRFGESGRMHASASRRSRFPSLRELFSGALGRFVPNPELRPERQDQLEVGGAYRSTRLDLTATTFATRLDGAIERVVMENGQFMRVNLDVVRTLGLEFGLAWRPRASLTVRGHHTFLNARSREDGEFVGLVEDRPDYLTSASVDWVHRWGVGLRVEGFLIGPRPSADVNDPEDGLAQLPAQGGWNARASYRRFPGSRLLSEIEIFVRVDNILDQHIDSQLGLPDPGRMTSAGLRITLD